MKKRPLPKEPLRLVITVHKLGAQLCLINRHHQTQLTVNAYHTGHATGFICLWSECFENGFDVFCLEAPKLHAEIVLAGLFARPRPQLQAAA